MSEPTYKETYAFMTEVCAELIARNAGRVANGTMTKHESLRQADMAGKVLGTLHYHTMMETADANA